MIKLYKISAWFSSHITWLVVGVTLLALFVPSSFTWMRTTIVTPLLGIVMFGMGMTLTYRDFLPIIRRPKDIIVGELAQFIIMPLVAWLLCKVMSLPQDLALGVIIVGCCPGGTASNVMCYLAKGDITLSVSMTTVSTLLAPIVTPALVLLLAGQTIEVDVYAMFLSIVQVVILPVMLGLYVNHNYGEPTGTLTPLLPMISTIAVTLIIGIVVSHNAAAILSCSLLVAVAVILHNVLGLSLGYMLGKMIGLPRIKRTAIAIEVGMQNSGLATSLAAAHFAAFPMATVPGAIFSVWHNFSGSIAAAILAKRK